MKCFRKMRETKTWRLQREERERQRVKESVKKINFSLSKFLKMSRYYFIFVQLNLTEIG